MTKKKQVPEKWSFIEECKGLLYSLLVWIACILLFISVIFVVSYFSHFIIKKEFFNEDFIELCIYIIIGSFSLIFIYDEKCKKRMGVKRK